MIIPERTFREHQEEWMAWYSGDPTRILNYYNTLAFGHTNAGRFWGNMDAEEYKNVVHMPLAQDICRTSSDLLFSEAPIMKADQNNDRLQAFIEDTLFEAKLLEASDMAAGLGGVYLKIDTDPAMYDYPFVTIRSPLSAKPRFKSGRLQSVTFYRVVHEEKEKKRYLLEHREKTNGGVSITFEFKEYHKGKWKDMRLEDAKEEHEINVQSHTLSGVSGIGVVYIPNLLPNRLFPSSNQGVADYQGSVGLLDSLDEVWTSWMRDIELGMSRILIDRDMLKDSEKEGSTRFDPHQRAFLQMDMDSWRIEGTNVKPVDNIQFDIRVDEHSRSAKELTMEIVSRCGYSPQSFGMNIEGRAESGTALKIRERKSLVTRQKKARYWQHALARLLKEVQEFDSAALLTSRYIAEDVSVILSDSIQEDRKETSETIRNLDQAKAVSTKIKVAMAHPDWNEDQIDEEVQAILNEQSTEIPDPFSVGA